MEYNLYSKLKTDKNLVPAKMLSLNFTANQIIYAPQDNAHRNEFSWLPSVLTKEGDTRWEEPITSPIFLQENFDDILFHDILQFPLRSRRGTQIGQSRKRT